MLPSLIDASLIVYNGGGYDQFVDDVLATDDEGRTVQAYSFAQTLADEEDGESTESTNEPAGHDHEHVTVNTHVWYDMTVAEVTAYAIADGLGSLDPDNAATYTANA
ncbi:metal ABC transporter substrate-binding protein [Rhodococcus pyridinivorans]|uniref:metal ABC transporter substrate-binding protein n=1 Tax=Rhodococcus pyridinivorans TaxID=103816 RepID=UPI00346448D4